MLQAITARYGALRFHQLAVSACRQEPAVEFNRDELRVVEMPAVNGTGTACAIAELYASAATGGSEIGLNTALWTR